ncbi:helix-turn-helix domain-containing protein [Nocardia wallacei]|uniref:helix-turn-helix domain-containing protein n=1 Tax=Nocardia wallacei TaxID=480035 RepID=UPI002457DB11|nr:helix-turn-helix transcriptional regulator [Nocardia wallacei]
MATSGSTLARRALGRQMHMLRERAAVKQAEAARIIGVSAQSIGRLEDGQNTRPNDIFLNILCDSYGASDKERRTVLALAHEVRTAHKHGGGWWRGYADQFIGDFDHYLALEDAASRLTTWRVTIVPGLLQTPDYRRAIAWAESPDAPTDEIEKRIEWATRRQTRLEDPNFAVDALLSEAVLRDQAGGPAVMSDQLRHLVKLSDLPNVSIRVVPFDACSILGPYVGSFYLLEFPPLQQSKTVEPPVVYVEEYAGDLYLERSEDVDRYRRALREINRVALDQEKSRAFILAVLKEHGE